MRRLALALLLAVSLGRAETTPDLPTKEEVDEFKTAMRTLLAKRLKDEGGLPVTIVLLDAIDDTTGKVGPGVTKAVQQAFGRYGVQNYRHEPENLQTLTLMKLRRAILAHRADILVVPFLQNTSFSLYLFDQRTPKVLYAHIENLPEAAKLGMSDESAAAWGPLLLRRLFYRYLRNEYFELPDDDSAPFLNSEIPRWIADTQNLTKIQKEREKRFYVSAAMGAALTSGESVRYSATWHSNLLGAQVGFRPFGRWYLEASGRAFSYNLLGGSIKYVFHQRESPFRVALGAGYYYLTARRTWSSDETLGMGQDGNFLAANAAILFPLGDIYLTVEAEVLKSMDYKAYVFTLAPGVRILF